MRSSTLGTGRQYGNSTDWKGFPKEGKMALVLKYRWEFKRVWEKYHRQRERACVKDEGKTAHSKNCRSFLQPTESNTNTYKLPWLKKALNPPLVPQGTLKKDKNRVSRLFIFDHLLLLGYLFASAGQPANHSCVCLSHHICLQV